ncbi:MAG: NifU family protein [Bacteroidales bacterium]|jgi:Fe-S cluster biogenesis protein NfuA|nr:NifU family protein [Bacteroidales bacterium]MBQ1605454.1 NifU family protein [Bacteroidales bacterium]MBQ1653470.1 NifU family protein [Bacteroidales bacterium]MBQ1731423.1 NifU family protein [Bacteroidales bacterium]MBQ2542983.1 NifU family protein [Bacteroidales bacterium]
MEEIVKKIQASIDEIKPFLQQDGGDIELIEVTPDFTVKVRLQGACGSCPYRIQTLKLGVEDKLKTDVPQVKEVVNVN